MFVKFGASRLDARHHSSARAEARALLRSRLRQNFKITFTRPGAAQIITKLVEAISCRVVNGSPGWSRTSKNGPSILSIGPGFVSLHRVKRAVVKPNPILGKILQRLRIVDVLSPGVTSANRPPAAIVRLKPADADRLPIAAELTPTRRANSATVMRPMPIFQTMPCGWRCSATLIEPSHPIEFVRFCNLNRTLFGIYYRNGARQRPAQRQIVRKVPAQVKVSRNILFWMRAALAPVALAVPLSAHDASFFSL
jgi:hypothetical protein